MKNAINLLAEQLGNKNKIIKAKANSIFEFIDLCQHDNEKITEVSVKISERLNNEVDLFKNKLVPLMLEIEKLVKDKVTSYTPESESSKYKIEEYDLPVVIGTMQSSGLVPNTFREPNRLQEESLYIPTPDKLDLGKYIELDNGSNSNGLNVFLGKYSDEDLLKLWEDCLSNISVTNPVLTSILSDPMYNIEQLLILYTFVYNLHKSKPSNVKAEDDKYFGILRFFLDELANYIAYVDNTFNSGRKRGKLIVGYSRDGFTVKVDEKLYQTFVDEGNTPEILLGLAVSDNKVDPEYLFYDKIVENRQFFTEAWNKKLRIEHYAQSVQNVSTYKAVYSILMPEIYNLVPNDLKDILLVSLDEAKLKLEDKLKTEKDSEIIDACYMAREIVGHVLFENTQFHKFTHYAMEIEKMNESFDCKSIFNFAVVQMLLDYLTDQVTLENA